LCWLWHPFAVVLAVTPLCCCVGRDTPLLLIPYCAGPECGQRPSLLYAVPLVLSWCCARACAWCALPLVMNARLANMPLLCSSTSLHAVLGLALNALPLALMPRRELPSICQSPCPQRLVVCTGL